VLSTPVLVLSWRKKQPVLSFLAGVLFGLSSLLRPIALLLGPFMGAVYLFQGRKWAITTKSVFCTQLLCLLIGNLLAYGPYLVVLNQSKSGSLAVSNQSAWAAFIGDAYGSF